MFPNRVNFEIVKVEGPGKLNARVWERGSGETMACGTGACAIAVAARILNITHNGQDITNDSIDINLPGGTLAITWNGEGEVYLEGPAVEVFSGEWN
jgi:diaminopimelate epimerase